MSNGSKNKNLLVIIVVLLLTNITLLGYFLWFKNPGKDPHAGNRDRWSVADMLKKEVGFDTVQITRYREMRENQKQVLRPMFDAMRTAKDSMFSQLGKSGPDDSLVLQMAAVIGQRQQELDLQTFRYFSKVRELCTPDQVPVYDSLINQMFRKMGRPKTEADKKNGGK